ncbi:hypothetical protein SAMN02745220_00625 [Desulfopila aestuarii DSM 18488]|uniref:Uncharacterized protein n=1 Tax=Desulfopila aestuarii DSM 18488 TaxID=1121416 RepID=A0A1M7XYD4_9BACT|nr:hypothetical protein SAMN02745220_00625 [Desulfopila aestuarii DSM 18488]
MYPFVKERVDRAKIGPGKQRQHSQHHVRTTILTIVAVVSSLQIKFTHGLDLHSKEGELLCE